MKKILGVIVCLLLALCLTGCGSKVKIVKTEASKVKYETYNNGLISLQIPKGWKVEIPQVDYIHYSFKVYNPKNPNYMFIFSLKLEGFLKSELARSTYANYYPTAIFSQLTPIDPQTTEGFYKAWNGNAKYVNENQLNFNYFPYLNDFNVVENLGKTALGGDIIRATYKNDKGELIQGLFTATVMDVGSYYISTDMWNIWSPQVDVAPLNVYNTILMVAPDTDFNEWAGVLDYCLSTLQFSDKFVNGFYGEEAQLMATIQANQKIYDQISDMIMDSWEKRNNSYDIISQKQSDATLGYERVYDTETGDVYKAYNGFTDNYKGNRYQPITDDMYTKTISGYIEK